MASMSLSASLLFSTRHPHLGTGTMSLVQWRSLGRWLPLCGPMVILTGPPVIAEWLGHTRRGDHWRCEGLSGGCRWMRECAPDHHDPAGSEGTWGGREGRASSCPSSRDPHEQDAGGLVGGRTCTHTIQHPYPARPQLVTLYPMNLPCLGQRHL